ncbi:MAG TPA: hypothetical protein VLL52_01140 [Anaerolineae bacterium]|nr:hypothetical protein [Anaerolineae bacterium]
MKKKWRSLLERLALAFALAFFIAVAPLPSWTPNTFLYWQVPATIFVLICYIGKILLDTFLYPPNDEE